MRSSTPARHAEWAHRSTWALLILGSTGLLVLSLYRAATVTFNHDESVSFAIFTWNPAWRASANHHVLNTMLMQWSAVLFGNSELSLRLPNLVAHGVYLLCSLALVTRMERPALRLAGFVLLNLNLSLSEFWFVARGYGLALALELASLYLLVHALEQQSPGQRGRDVLLAAAAGALAVLANFSFLNYYLPLLLVAGWLLATDATWLRLGRRHLPALLALVLGGGLFVALAARRLLRLQRHGQLYMGGHEGFLADTVNSLVQCSLGPDLQSPTLVTAASAVLVVAFVGLLLFGLQQLISRPRATVVGPLVVMLGMAVVLPVIEHRVAGALFPVHRTALFYIPLYAVALLYGLRAMARLGAGRGPAAALTLAGAIAVPLAWQFVHDYRARSSCAWWEDSHNREVLQLIDRDRSQGIPGPVKLRASWVMEPSLNYYRISRGYTWLAPVRREPITRAGAGYIYAYQGDLDSLAVAGDSALARFPDIGTALLRVHHAESP